MAVWEEARIPLSALSGAQREIVRRNLPLVLWTIRKMAGLTRRGAVSRSHAELYQEGSLALVDAVRRHDPLEHGSFGTYAAGRIRFAVRRFAQENESAVRVPFISQRRAREQQRHRATSEVDRHRPDDGPRVRRFSELSRSRRAMRRRTKRLHEDDMDTLSLPTIGEMARERLDGAMREVLREMKASPRGQDDYARVVERCMIERWEVPEEEWQMSIRCIANETGSSVGRITRCEERFREMMASRLELDPVFTGLRQLAQEQQRGWQHRADSTEIAALAGREAVAHGTRDG